MPALPEISIGLASDMGLLLGERLDQDPGPAQKGIELPASGLRRLHIDHDRRLDERRGRDAARLRLDDRAGVAIRIVPLKRIASSGELSTIIAAGHAHRRGVHHGPPEEP